MKKNILAIAVVIISCTSIKAQTSKAETLSNIKKIYAEVKNMAANNGKDGMAPLDIKIKYGNDREATLYFTKYREDSSLDYTDASSCYLITENKSSGGNKFYREVVFDPNEGVLLFSFFKVETNTGNTVEARYYFDNDGNLVEEKHKAGGNDISPENDSWSSSSSTKEIADKYIDVFCDLMNYNLVKTAAPKNYSAASDPERMKFIRSAYSAAKTKSEKEGNTASLTIRDQTSCPPTTTNINFFLENKKSDNCYFISKRQHHNNMGSDTYTEFLFEPSGNNLIFSFSSAAEEGEQYEWRYYFDKNGRCIEAKTTMDDSDNGATDKKDAQRYSGIVSKIYEIMM